ncbi:MAG TPA: heme exporter protein CcmD [Bacteroidia bacterium]|nr:heme exporter protein CcmD [Bacteroidia bacterium]HNT80785.1 heme exporter protein CcmD [Bacteroidia bacterium]
METKMTPEQSLQIINEMINSAKSSMNKHHIYFLIWGWLMIASAVSVYLIVYQQNNPMGHLSWMVAGIIGGIASSLYGKNQAKKIKSVTFIDKAYQYVWLSYGITLLCILFGSIGFKSDPGPYITILTALPVLVTGLMLQFKPFVIGAAVFWIMGLISFFVDEPTRLLFFSVAIFFGYIIPGYMLRKQENND